MSQYRVVAPYVTLKVADVNGQPGFQGLYEGAVVDSERTDKESLKRHLDRGMVEKVETAPAKKAAPSRSQSDSSKK